MYLHLQMTTYFLYVLFLLFFLTGSSSTLKSPSSHGFFIRWAGVGSRSARLSLVLSIGLVFCLLSPLVSWRWCMRLSEEWISREVFFFIYIYISFCEWLFGGRLNVQFSCAKTSFRPERVVSDWNCPLKWYHHCVSTPHNFRFDFTVFLSVASDAVIPTTWSKP